MKGIYQIFNKENGKRYIGQSNNLSHRKSCHLYDLKNKRHKNTNLQNDYDKNPESIKFEVLCTCKYEELDDLERFYIEKYDTTNPKNGYNQYDGGKMGFRVTDLAKKKIGCANKGNQSMKGLKLSDEWRKHLSDAQPHKKKILCVETGKEYPSFAEAARQTGLNRSKIVSVCTGKRKSTGGYHFRYAEQKRSG